MATVGKCPGNTMKVFMYLWSAITTLRIVRQTVFLLSFSASPTSYRYVPLAKKRKAMQIICGTVVAWLRRVGFLIWGSRSRQRYNIPSAENLYLSYKCSSENASGFCLSLITLSLRKALCTIWDPMSTGFSKYGEAILLLRMLCCENGFGYVLCSQLIGPLSVYDHERQRCVEQNLSQSRKRVAFMAFHETESKVGCVLLKKL